MATRALNSVAMQRYDTFRHEWRDVAGSADQARALLAAGAPVDGDPGDRETPLITARLRDGDGRTALNLTRTEQPNHPESTGHVEVLAILAPLS
jgi:hypothetical protein